MQTRRERSRLGLIWTNSNCKSPEDRDYTRAEEHISVLLVNHVTSEKGGESRGGCRKVGPALERRCQERGFRPELLLECQQLVGSALLACPRQLPRQAQPFSSCMPFQGSRFFPLQPSISYFKAARPLSLRDSIQAVGPFLPNTDKLFYPCAESHFPTTPNSIFPSASGAEQMSTKFPPLPKTSEKDLGQLWFQSYNAWFKRGRKKGADYRYRGIGERKKLKNSKGGTSLRKIQWPKIPVPTHGPALGAGVKN